MMGNTAEFYADQRALDPAAEPDRLIGEDVIPAGVYVGAEAGLRNMGDPRADRDPDPYRAVHQHLGQRRGTHQQWHPEPRLPPGGRRRTQRRL